MIELNRQHRVINQVLAKHEEQDDPGYHQAVELLLGPLNDKRPAR